MLFENCYKTAIGNCREEELHRNLTSKRGKEGHTHGLIMKCRIGRFEIGEADVSRESRQKKCDVRTG